MNLTKPLERFDLAVVGAGIVGLGTAAELARAWLADDGASALANLRDRLERGILASVEEVGINGGGVGRVANTSNLYFDHVEAEALVIALDLKGLPLGDAPFTFAAAALNGSAN